MNETVFKVVPYPTDQQRRDIQAAAWRKMFAAMTYDGRTQTYKVTSLALAAAGIPEPNHVR